MFRKMLIGLATAAATMSLGVIAPALAQQAVEYGPQGPFVLIAPDGRILDHPPEYGSVEVYFNPRGQRVLVDRNGHLVATEVPLRQAQRARRQNPDIVRLPRSGRNDSVQRLDLPPANQPDDEYSRLETGAIPDQGRVPIVRAPEAPDSFQNTQPGLPSNEPPRSLAGKQSKADVTALQVLLDRAGASPGVIDGRMGDNVAKALDAYATMTGERLRPSDTREIRRKLQQSGGPAMQRYTITPSDAAGPYVASIPSDYSQKAQLTNLSYTSTAEMLAERFHMDESYMKAINPGVDFSVPGTVIKVADPEAPKHDAVALVIADKALSQVRAYTANGDLVAAYPSTIGSTDTPSPSGTVSVARIAPDPNYTYNPKINFKQGNNDHVLTIPPGPNGPVGNMWIALSKPTYGIHGTPEPSLIGKSNSHGCVRLTNWDAHELAGMIKPGITVKFVD